MEPTKPPIVKTEPEEPMARLQSLEVGEPLHEHADEALRFIEQHQGFTYTPEQDKAVLKKIDRHLMPLLFFSYLFQYMDKSIMAQSVVYGRRQNLGLEGQQYSWCSPLDAKFLNDEEKMVAVERLRDNRTGVANREFKRSQLIEALKDPLVYYNFFFAILVVVPNSGVSFFGTLIIESFGYDAFVSSLLLMPYGAVVCIGLPLAGYITSKHPDTRCINQFASALPAIIGSALVFYLQADNQAGRLAGFYLTGFSNATLPLQFASMNSNTAGHTKRSITNAIMFLGYATGFIIGPQFFLASEAPVYQTGFRTMLITFTLLTAAPVGMYAYLTWQNKTRDAAIMHSGGENIYTENEEFLDLTDREQIHFRYAK
ncbi:hypothetical protein LTS07_010311 [Exophiala sideris]|uniref:Major facilitator superfamily (MFS) profile domain-containing protein n=1 Tax=Exophiala sideris TaxID=1016849 RepID=A0ABR0J8V1_9EURO|nr:hypothetical protein LTS07_010311 [Exophiala sideris]KAK5037327.1 hypothetical protein LTR13_004483 [Exophiala sideris]KAK5058991.1 hypothetical protein LTR69_006278 [Exophiala sideris]KAK5182823.1 hypothetical protein LTR44_004531 [Eurotiomycetes sp. CCFEE 6388]